MGYQDPILTEPQTRYIGKVCGQRYCVLELNISLQQPALFSPRIRLRFAQRVICRLVETLIHLSMYIDSIKQTIINI